MPRKKKQFSLIEAVGRLQETGISLDSSHIDITDIDKIPSLDDRIKLILNINTKTDRKAGDMLFFIMYDIESNKVRRLIVKYLEQKGCHRVQKSIFLADLPGDVYNQIRNDLAEVQAAYDNYDSILIVPISTDYLNSMKDIKKTIDVDLIMKTKNTLFF